MDKVSWQYKLRNFTSVDIGVFENYFENMPFDPYVTGDFRKRRLYCNNDCRCLWFCPKL